MMPSQITTIKLYNLLLDRLILELTLLLYSRSCKCFMSYPDRQAIIFDFFVIMYLISSCLYQKWGSHEPPH